MAKEQHYDDPRELINKLKELYSKNHEKYIFRGQGKDWALKPKIFRDETKEFIQKFVNLLGLKNDEKDLIKFEWAEEAILKHFIDFAQQIKLPIPNAHDVLEYFKKSNIEQPYYEYIDTPRGKFFITSSITHPDKFDYENLIPNDKKGWCCITPIYNQNAFIIAKPNQNYYTNHLASARKKYSLNTIGNIQIEDAFHLAEIPNQFDDESLLKCCEINGEVTESIKKAIILFLNHHYSGRRSRSNVNVLPMYFSNNFQLIALAQHHGLPTRFLDWTRDPLVAIYFAARKKEKDAENIVIWVMDLYYLKTFPFVRLERFNNPGFHIIDNIHCYDNHFLHAQNGLFTYIDGAEEYYLKTKEWPDLEKSLENPYYQDKYFIKLNRNGKLLNTDKLLTKITFPVSKREQLLKILLLEEKRFIHHFMPSYDYVVESVKAYPEIINSE